MLCSLLLLLLTCCKASQIDGSDDYFADYNLPQIEIDSLYDIYNATKGDYWIWSSDEGNVWNFSQPNPNPCFEEWQGLTCSLNMADSCLYILNIQLDYMNLTGSLPMSIGNFKYLSVFSTQYNAIDGQIPPSISNWNYSRGINVCSNQLTGPVPVEICQMKSLYMVALLQNQLTGTLLDCFSEFTNLAYLQFDFNHFHGHIPASYSNISGIQYLTLAFNQLSGPLPNMSLSLTHLNVQSNQLTGTIPAQYGDLSHLTFFYAVVNQLSGPIPDALGSASSLQFLSLVDNGFTGTLPYTLGNLSQLLNIDVSHNFISGSFPTTIGPQQQLLGYVGMTNNYLSGSLTSSLGTASKLQILFLVDNLLTGKLDGVFNSTLQSNLTTIDLSTNLFTGEVPTEPFQIEGLTSFAAVSNCIHGSLSPLLCNAVSLQALALDGLSTGSACQDRFFSSHLKPFSEIHSYGLRYSAVSGSLPLCLFNMSHLRTLHLSGNGIVGTLTSEDLVVSPSLTDLSLSHNQLYSSIPLSIQNRSWTSLDLSYNLLDGTLMEHFPRLSVNSSLYLEVNRLSGFIPTPLRDAVNIAMLDGNLFGCRADRSDLPSHDPNVKVFECGSNSFNYTIYVWVGCVFLGLCLWMYVKYAAGNVETLRSRSVVASDGSPTMFKSDSGQIVSFSGSQLLKISITNWLTVFKRSTGGAAINGVDSHAILSLSLFADRIRLLYLSVALFVCLVLLPSYTVLSYYYNTYSYEYAWQVTGVYLTGFTATVVILLLLAVLFFLSIVLFAKINDLNRLEDELNAIDKLQAKSNGDLNGLASFQDQLKYYLFVGAVSLLNCAVVIGANVGYVYVEYHYSVLVVKLTQLSLAGFKLLWYSSVIRPLLKMYRIINEAYIVTATAAPSTEGVRSSLHLEVFIVLFNNLVAPFVAVAFVSSDCFYNVFTDPPVVDASYTFSICQHRTVSGMNHNNTVCEVEYSSVMNTSYVPPFTYSYQCSSAYITAYAPIFVFTFVLIAFVSPATQGLASYAVNQWSVDSKDALWNRLLISALPPLLLPLNNLINDNTSNARTLFESDLFIVRLINALAILLTFGSVLPPLAVIGCASLFSYTYFVQLCIGRVVVAAVAADKASLLSRLNKECCGVPALLSGSVSIIVPFGVLFYGLFLFDMLGSAEGAMHAVWAPVVVVALPVLTGGVWWFVSRVLWRKLVGRKSLGVIHFDRDGDLNEEFGQSLLNNEIM